MRFKDYYRILELEPSASATEIKSAYRRLAKKYHPDVSKQPNAEERFKEISEAYEALRDPERRAAYDQLRNRGFRPGDEINPAADFGGFDFDFGSVEGSGFSDFFEQLFGAARAQAHARTRTRARTRASQPAQDLEFELEVGLEELYGGGRRRIQLDDPMTGRERSLEVKIPAGVLPGQSIRLAGQGAPGSGGERGDLLLRVKLKPHPEYRLDGRDVHARLALTPWEAALGARVPVPTLGGVVEMSIPAGSTSGRKLRLKGRGLPGTPPGDHYVTLEVQVPAPETETQRAAFRQLAERFPHFDPRR